MNNQLQDRWDEIDQIKFEDKILRVVAIIESTSWTIVKTWGSSDKLSQDLLIATISDLFDRSLRSAQLILSTETKPEVLVFTDQSAVYTAPVGSDYYLIAVEEPSSNLGMFLLVARKMRCALKPIFLKSDVPLVNP